MNSESYSLARLGMRYLLAALFATAGTLHLLMPNEFAAITPAWVPLPEQVIFLYGVFELVAAVAVLTKSLRKPAGVGPCALRVVCLAGEFQTCFRGFRYCRIAGELVVSRA